VEWIVFAGFALFIWWRLVKDDYQRSLEDQEDHDAYLQGAPAAAADQPQPDQTSPDQPQQKVQP